MWRVEARVDGGEWFFVGEAATIEKAFGFAEGYRRGYEDAGPRHKVETTIYDLTDDDEDDPCPP